MKISLGICAKELPTVADYYASVTKSNHDDDDCQELGKTNIETETQNPTWTKAIIVNDMEEENPSGTISISIYNNKNDKNEIIKETFELADIWNNSNKAIAKSSFKTEEEGTGTGGGIIAVHMEEAVPTGTFTFKLRGMDLDNLDSRLGKMAIRKSDPFYEIKNMQGTMVYKSETISNNLNPVWKETPSIDIIDVSCKSGNLEDSTIQLIVMDNDDKDQDKNVDNDDTKAAETTNNMELIGVVSTTIHDLLQQDESSSKPNILELTKKGKVTGKLVVESMQVDGMNDVSSNGRKLLEYVSQVSLADEKALVAQRTREYATHVMELANVKQEEANKVVNDLVRIQTVIEEKQKAAQAEKELSKVKRCTGTLQLQLCGQNLPDLDGLFPGLFDKTDAYFEIHGYNGDVLYTSETIDNNLNPEWEKVELDLNDLTNGNLDMKVRITICDQDKNDKKEYIGQVLQSVNTMLEGSAKAEAVAFDIVKGMQKDSKQGQLVVKEATLVDYVNVKERAQTLKDEADEIRMSSYDLEKASKVKAEEAQNAMVKAKKAERDAMSAEEAAKTATRAVQELMAALSL